MVGVKIILFCLLSCSLSAIQSSPSGTSVHVSTAPTLELKLVSPADPTRTTDATRPCDSNDEGGCIASSECQEVCGCDRIFKFDEQKGDCVVNLEYLRELTKATHYMSEDKDVTLEDSIETRLRERVDRVFGGILISAILFIACASVCVLSVCLFCCHIRYSDHKLKNEVNALAAKLKIDIKTKGSAPLLKNQRDQKEESCNVVVEDANIMCV